MQWYDAFDSDQRVIQNSGWLALNSHAFIKDNTSPAIYFFRESNKRVVYLGIAKEKSLAQKIENKIYSGNARNATSFKILYFRDEKAANELFCEFKKYVNGLQH